MFLPFIDIFLAFLMFILTVAVVVLTCKVKRYAGKTLEVAEKSLKVTQKSLEATQESLDFFAKPLVGIKRPADMEFNHHPPDSFQTIAHSSVHLINESPMPIRIDSADDVSVRLLPDKSDQPAETIDVVLDRLSVFGVRRILWPLLLNDNVLYINLKFISGMRHALYPNLGTVKVGVELLVKYTYRGRQYQDVEELCYTLNPS